MLVAIRIRPLNQREVSLQDMDIIRTEDKLLVKYIFTLKIYRLFLTKWTWSMKTRVRSRRCSTGLRNRDTTSIGSFLKPLTQRQSITTHVKAWSALLYKGTMAAYLHTEPLEVERHTLWRGQLKNRALCSWLLEACSSKFKMCLKRSLK